MITRLEGEGMTEFTIRRIKAEVIERELAELANNFEGTPGIPWTGQDIADALRERIKNHPALSNGTGDTP
jgi:hypothetical protein